VSGLIDNIDDFATDQPGGTTVTRTVQNTYDSNGRLVAGSTSTFPIETVTVPTDGRDMVIAKDCAITTEVRAILTVTQLYTRTPGFDPDQLTIDSEQWTVFNVRTWPTGDGDTFYRALVARRALS
jgi:hypothetical protein